jgi:hypothetical protein
MKIAHLGAALALAIAPAIGGCSAVQKATDYLASPQFTTAANNVRNVAVAFDCGIVVVGAQLAGTIANEVNAGNAAISTTGKVYAVASSVCIALGGTPKALPAGTTVAVSVPN